MLAIHDLPLFVLSGVLLNICPGPDTLYVVSRGGAQGWPAGAVAALGIASGCVVHILAAALGLSAVLAASATAFSAVKWAGAAYLVYVGLGMLRARGSGADSGRVLATASLRTVYLQGFLTNVLNPKVGPVLPGLPAAVHRSRGARSRPCPSSCSGPYSTPPARSGA